MVDNIKQIIGQRINTVLAIKNIKQKDLATAIGVSDNIISYYVSGKRTPNTEQIIAISKYLDVSSDYLLGLSDVQSANIELKAICEYTGLSEEALQGIKKTMQKATFFDTLSTFKEIFEDPKYLSRNNIIANEKAENICDKFNNKVNSITEKDIYNCLFSLSPNQVQLIDSLKNVINAKIKCNIVSEYLFYEIQQANNCFSSLDTEIDKSEFTNANSLLTFVDRLNDDLNFKKWKLAEILNKFSENVIKKLLGDNNADD